MGPVTLILKDAATNAQVEGVLRALGLELRPADVPEGMMRQLWMTADRRTAVNFIDDSLTNVRSIFMRGEEIESLAERLKEELPLWERDELLKHALFLLIQGSEPERRRVAMEVAAEMDEYDAASAGVLTAFLKMDEPSIRLAGARAFRNRPWPEFRSTAAELAADPDPDVAAVGRDMLDRIIELHGDE